MHTHPQLVSVLMAITGIVLFAYADGFESANLIGVALSVGAAIGAACYKVCTLACHTMHFPCTQNNLESYHISVLRSL